MGGYFLTCPATFKEDFDFQSRELVVVIDSLIEVFMKLRWGPGIPAEDLKGIRIGGLGCLFSAFMTTLIATKNKTAAVHHAKKALLYYAEFIAQIKQDANSFLKLTATDAVLFSYKKTIFTIDKSLQCSLSLQEENMSQLIYGYVQVVAAYIEALIRRDWDDTPVGFASELGKAGLCREPWSLGEFVACRNHIVSCAAGVENVEQLRLAALHRPRHTL